MIIFKFYTLRNIQNSQTATKKISKEYSWIFSSSILKNVQNKPKVSKFLQDCIQDDSSKKSILRKSFKQHQGKVSIFGHQRKLKNWIQNSFFKENANQEIHQSKK